MPEIYDMVKCEICGDWYHLKCVSLEQFQKKANSGTAINVSSDCRIVILYKVAITEVIL